MQENNLVWAIFDSREGNKNQLLGILNELGMPYRIIQVNYNMLSSFPNFLIQLLYGSLHIKEKIRCFIRKPYPRLVISCGRRTAPLSIKVYKILKKKPMLVHIMNPRYTFFKSFFNIIFVPEHDNAKNNSNIFKTLGSPNNMKFLLNKKSKNYQKKNANFITLLLGGDHYGYKLSANKVKFILKSISKVLKTKKSLFISTSRRTNKEVIEFLDNQARADFLFIKDIFHPSNTREKANPLSDYLHNSAEVIVTGDSMSMISELCSIGKPVRIFYDNSFCSKKHILFCKKMIEDGYAFSLDTLGKKCDRIKILNTSKQVADKIKDELLSKSERNLY